jgi:ABC-2 type transport system permease protein
MPIFDQGYQHWQGRVSGHAMRWSAITRQGVRQQIARRRTKWLVVLAFAPALALAAVLVFWGLFEQQSSLLAPIMFLIRSLPDAIQAGPKAYRAAVWTMAFYTFFTVETFFAMLLVLAVGPDLISQDLRFNAMPLYFSRPLRRLDYFAGKLGVIGVFLAAVAIGPALVAYVLGVAFSMDVTVIKDTWRLLLGSVAFGLVVVFSAGTLMLAISSLSRNSRLVGATWVGFWIIGNFAATVLELSVKREWCPLVSYTTNLERVREELLEINTAREKFRELWQAGQQVGQEAPRPPLFSRRRRRRPIEPPPAAEDQAPPPLQTPEYLRYPWTWSAGVLSGLFVLSVLTLSTRVKSLDRLR